MSPPPHRHSLARSHHHLAQRAIIATQVVGTPLSTYPGDSLATANLASIAEVTPHNSASSVTASSTSIDMAQTVAAESTEQTNFDSGIPHLIVIVAICLLFICMALEHPRFLARLFASIHQHQAPSRSWRARSTRTPALPSEPYLFKMKKTAKTNEPRKAGGGELYNGWILRAGRACTTNTVNGDDINNDEDVPPSASLAPPPHIPSTLSYLPFSSALIAAPLTRFPSPFRTRATIVPLCLINGYLIFVMLALVWRSDLGPTSDTSGYGYDFTRSGLVALSQVPIVVALGVRGNLPGLCLGHGYERLKIYHKLVGRLIFVSCTLHAGFYLHKWTATGMMATYTSKPFVRCGLLAWSSVLLMAISSLLVVRRACYGVFEICHIIGMTGLLVGLTFHVDVARPFCLAATVVYFISFISSIAKTRLAPADLVALGGSTTTIVTIRGISTGWRAGQHVRLRVPALGVKRALEAHPFTIASAPNTGGMVLMCKATGDWTNALYELAASGGEIDRSDVGIWKRRAVVLLEGPYGGLGNTLPPSFSSILIIVGGSGISHGLGIAHDLIARSPSGVVGARTIDLVWVVRAEPPARAVMPTLASLVDNARAWEVECLKARRRGANLSPPTALRVQIYVTRCPDSSPLTIVPVRFAPQRRQGMGDDNREVPKFETEDQAVLLNDKRRDMVNEADNDPILGHGSAHLSQPSAAEHEKAAWLALNFLHRNAASVTGDTANPNKPMSTIAAFRGRPGMTSLLGAVADETIMRHGRVMTKGTGMFVTVCGPEQLVEAARDAVRNLPEWKRAAVGGCEFEQEFFGY